MMPTSLERIADALERIADALAPQETQERPPALQDGPTITNPLLAWFVTQVADQDAEEAQDVPLTFSDLKPSTSIPVATGSAIVQRGRPKNRSSHCGRCGRVDTRRMNHSDSCRECVDEPWWTE